ncbi:hypothetical protein LshimejAT787_0202350 [Lyophyllum shimeji]|uniref:Uncharacterized protein n=1 Tax=Lyophyllum shimeji TaxID=47721 RepID=A0A9P3PET5_LYOSH|nr:hypothetical protein LshimejAT787_0202350 [Lyophyllum shimeji]
MFLSKYLIVLTAIVVASASPAVKRQDPQGPLCHYVVTPATFPGEVGLDTEMSYAIGRELAVEVPSHTINSSGCTTEPQDDGTYNVQCRMSAVGLTDAETAALIETWTGKVVQGSPQNGFIQWTIDEVHCDAE